LADPGFSIHLPQWSRQKPTLHIIPYPLTYSNHSLLDKNHRENIHRHLPSNTMAITQISSKDDLSGLPSPKTHAFSKKTFHDDEQPNKTTKKKVFFH